MSGQSAAKPIAQLIDKIPGSSFPFYASFCPFHACLIPYLYVALYMLFSITNILGIIGLSVIFITAALARNGMEWLPGIVFLLLILAVRNVAIEVTRKKEILLSISVFVIVLLTVFFITN